MDIISNAYRSYYNLNKDLTYTNSQHISIIGILLSVLHVLTVIMSFVDMYYNASE